MQTVYIETTIPSFYHTRRKDAKSIARQKWTREWWTQFQPSCELFSSAATILELEKGSTEETEKRLSLLHGLELLDIIDEVERIAGIYIDRLVMPDDPGGDALHLAVSSYYGLDVLLTWNCRHLANPHKMGHIQRVNDELGLATPILTTPLNFLSGGEDNER